MIGDRWLRYFVGDLVIWQKKKDEEKAREKELQELFKVAIKQPKVPVGKFT